jgi:aspartate kinase
VTNQSLPRRLLEVYRRLRNIDAAVGIENTQTELLEEAKSLIQDICDDHLFAAEAVLTTPDFKEELKKDIKNECQELIEYIHASKRFKLEVNSRSKDRVVSFGERLSCRFMTCVLKDRVCNHSSTACVAGL